MKRMPTVLLIVAVLFIVSVLTLSRGDVSKKTVIQNPLYAAMGDSVAAGLGLESASDSSACGRTNESYPVLSANSLRLNLKNYACSGATTAQGITGNQTVNNLALKAQLEEVLAGEKPKLITLTIGANDIGWTDILARCVTTVCGTDGDTADVDRKLQVLKTDLKEVMQRIHDHFMTSAPTVMITGYYRVFPDSGSCSTIPGIEPAEQQWWNAQGDKLDAALADVTSGDSFANFAPVNFSGHDLCSSAPWIQNLQARAPFHPTDEGQKVIADTITQTYQALGR